MQSAECRVQNAGCRMQSAECRVQNAECRMQSAECRVQKAGCRMQSAECRVQNAECRMQNEEGGEEAEGGIGHANGRGSPSFSPFCLLRSAFCVFFRGQRPAPHKRPATDHGRLTTDPGEAPPVT